MVVAAQLGKMFDETLRGDHMDVQRITNIGRLVIPMILSCGLFFTVPHASAQQVGTVVGTIVSSDTDQPLPGANVTVVGSIRGASTNIEGQYSLKLLPGTYTIKASFIGYESVERNVTVVAGQTSTVDFQLAESIVQFGESVVVIGSRSERAAIETPVPIDVISGSEVRESGQPELNQALAYLAPSFNASHQTISDGTDHVNPASLRGLGPDQVLVLVNGKRRHSSALVHVNGTFGRGTVGVDLNAIPKAAIERIEVLRDGAAAQYGSDAISGVINIVLKEQANSILINGGVGANNLISKNEDILVDEADGETENININYGFKIGDNGFFNITGDYLDRGRTNRSNVWTGAIFFPEHPDFGYTASIRMADEAELSARILTREDFTMKTGQGDATVGSVFFNTSVAISEDAEFYAFGGLTYRDGMATGFYRLPNSEARVNLNVYPKGFLPEIHTEINDRSVSAGVKGIRNDWLIDASVTHGGNSFQFNIENSINASIGESSPVSFDAGRLKFSQSTGNLDLLKTIDTGGELKSLSLALGSEFRVENYQIEAGQFESYSLGNGGDVPGTDFDTTASGGPKNPGSQVFPGFQPANEVNRYRNSIGVYASLESEITDQLLLDVAGRFENYSDFGNSLTGKFSGRYEVAENFALRGAISTGFRAPSLHQIWFNNVSIQFVLNEQNQLVPSRVLSANNISPVTKAFGIPDLKEETSVNISAGFTARPTPDLSITADFYRITIDDRIVLSSRFESDDNLTTELILAPFAASLGVNAAQFFANAVDTETQGVDVVAAYTTRLGEGRLILTASGNVTETQVQSINVPQSLQDQIFPGDELAVRDALFNREEENRLEDALPREKGNFSVKYDLDRLSILARANYFGKIEYKPTSAANDETFGAKTLFDLDFSYEVMEGLKISVGGYNVLNTFPDKHAKTNNLSDGRFIYSRRVTQFGMNGGYYYTRFSLEL
jgi:iron complex outermembrane receptor protein